MTSGNSSNSDRLDRIEAIVESNSRAIQATSAAIQANSAAIQATSANLDKLSTELQETKAIANSNSRAIQAMMEQQATDRLKHEEAMKEMRDIMKRVVETQSGLTRILINHDEDRPTILRRLMAIENRVDRILEKEQE